MAWVLSAGKISLSDLCQGKAKRIKKNVRTFNLATAISLNFLFLPQLPAFLFLVLLPFVCFWVIYFS